MALEKSIDTGTDGVAGNIALLVGKKKSKQKFDISNAAHKTRRDEILKKTNGNRNQAQQLLEKEFEL